MSSGKYLSLEEARKAGKLKQFADQHPSTGDMDAWDQLFEAMASGKRPKEDQTSSAETSED